LGQPKVCSIFCGAGSLFSVRSTSLNRCGAALLALRCFNARAALQVWSRSARAVKLKGLPCHGQRVCALRRHSSTTGKGKSASPRRVVSLLSVYELDVPALRAVCHPPGQCWCLGWQTAVRGDTLTSSPPSALAHRSPWPRSACSLTEILPQHQSTWACPHTACLAVSIFLFFSLPQDGTVLWFDRALFFFFFPDGHPLYLFQPFKSSSVRPF